ncbi:MAG: exodeoxyribonuclease III [Flavobacteriales bacterium]
MRVISYNVNGIRAAISKDWLKWLKAANPDVLCLQEVKATVDQININLFEELGYYTYWHSAEKKGYSGVAILCKNKPDNIQIGCGIEKYDKEGRIIRADFGDVSFISAYFPSGSSGEERQAFKMDFLDDFLNFINELKKDRQKLVISGDYNICHQTIDIHNPISNKNSSGFLPEERLWVSEFLKSGFTDSYRLLNPNSQEYSWWTYRFNARKKNLGWRIDYNMVSNNLKDKITRAVILSEAHHSDHCPVLLELELE